jgi:ribosomal protein S18 acetylase RimI-like enzyme
MTQLNVNSIDINLLESNVSTSRESTAAIAQTAIQIQTATITDRNHIIAAIVLAFSRDPIVRWMYPDSHQYLTHFPRFLHIFGDEALARETAYFTRRYSGVALWLPPGVEADLNSAIEILQQSVFESEQTDLFAILEQMSHYHPKEPHWYLPMIGVDPAQQGKGYGSALIQHVLKQCDRDRCPAYLEASKPANVIFYKQHGFEVLETIQVGTSPPLFPMIRYPN